MRNNALAMQHTCTLTGTLFEVTQQDLDFYTKIAPVFDGTSYGIPSPTLCPQARQQRGMVWRGKDYFYRPCSKTGEMCMSIFPPDVDMVAYSEEAYQSDDWNGLEWGREFDFSRPFFEQFFELWYQTPKQIANAYYSENCEYIINAHKNKNCYLMDEVDRCRDCLYGYCIQDCENVLSSFYARKSELCYQASQIEKCYEVFYAHNVHNSHHCAFVENCRNCKNCLMCCGLRNAEYMIENKPVTREQFEHAWQSVFDGTRASVQRTQEHFDTFRSSVPIPASIQINTEDCTGDQISNSKECYDCFNIDNCRNCRFCTDIHNSVDAYDVHIYEGEIMYECLHAGPEGYAQYFSHWPWFSSHVFYCSQLLSCKNCFGCSGLKHQQYCILNKQYEKDEYERTVSHIIDHMIETREWGEFFPAKYSPYAYNQSMAAYYFPLSKDAALQQGFTWKDEEDPYSDTKGIDPPTDLVSVSDDITNDVLVSTESGRKYKVVAPELAFHKNYNIPLPDTAPMERMEAFVHANSRQLHSSNCAKCKKSVQTIHGEERIVLCQECS